MFLGPSEIKEFVSKLRDSVLEDFASLSVRQVEGNAGDIRDSSLDLEIDVDPAAETGLGLDNLDQDIIDGFQGHSFDSFMLDLLEKR